MNEHLLTNSGNLALNDILFDVQQASGAWQASLFADTDANGFYCIVYRLTPSNNDVNPSYNVVIRDYTPPYTVYFPAALCSRTSCWINEPAINETGTIHAETDQLLPGDAYHLQFSVRVQ